MEFYKYLLATLALGLTGCDSVGEYVATILPEKVRQADTTKLASGDDGVFIDPTQIGTQPNNATQQDLPIGNNATELYQDPTQSSDYQEMIGALDDPSMDPGQGMGAFAGQGEYSKAMTIDESDISEGVRDPTSEYQQQIGEFSIPDTSEGGDVTSQYLSAGGLADPAESQQGNQDPTALYLGNSGNGLTTDRSAPSKKPNPQGAPPKKNVPSALRPKGGTNTPSRSSSQTSRPKERGSIQIGVPGNINPSYAAFDPPVAVPQLLDRGTSMSFEANLQQTRPLPKQGLVYWVIHSQRNGFSRFQLPIRDGELPQKLRGVVPQFTPTSGPFKMFLVLVDENNEVSYLTSAKDISWNP